MNKGNSMTDLTTMMMSEAMVSQQTSSCGLAPPNMSRREFIKGRDRFRCSCFSRRFYARRMF